MKIISLHICFLFILCALFGCYRVYFKRELIFEVEALNKIHLQVQCHNLFPHHLLPYKAQKELCNEYQAYRQAKK